MTMGRLVVPSRTEGALQQLSLQLTLPVVGVQRQLTGEFTDRDATSRQLAELALEFAAPDALRLPLAIL